MALLQERPKLFCIQLRKIILLESFILNVSKRKILSFILRHNLQKQIQSTPETKNWHFLYHYCDLCHSKIPYSFL